MMRKQINTDQQMKQLGAWLANKLPVNFCLELVGDVGAGKTTLIKGLVAELNPDVNVTSPSFVINNRYQIDKQRIISHFDFYRLVEIGLEDQQLAEDLTNKQIGVVIEWGETIKQVLPEQRTIIKINYSQSESRLVEIEGLS